jgi:NAD-dependent DNA ligase
MTPEECAASFFNLLSVSTSHTQEQKIEALAEVLKEIARNNYRKGQEDMKDRVYDELCNHRYDEAWPDIRDALEIKDMDE